ncbi:MAG: hypothetical protein B7Y39_16370 [Bdellovibrio sp. 28-41-41]|nr:MAG: hypothetical protein B7Y39_16370 [Bdellovibrio sp. 28-41-41]
MRLKILLLVSGILFVCSCSNPSKPPAAVVPPTTSAAPVKAEVPARVEVAKSEMICKRDGKKRSLEVESLKPKGCKLWYARYELRNSIASSVKGNDHCEQVREKIRTRLVDAGFECMTVTNGDAQKTAESAKK